MPDSDQRFKDFAEASSDWFWEMDENCRFTYFSDRFTEITGVPATALLGKTREETGIPNVDDADWQKHLSDLAGHRSFKNFRHPRTLSDGRIVHLSINGKAIYDEEGNFRGYRGTGSEITEYIVAEEAQQAIEARFHGVFDQASVGMAIVTPAGRFLQVNKAYCSYLGYRSEELTGSHYNRVIHPDDLDGVTIRLQQLLDGSTQEYKHERRYRHKRGHYVWGLAGLSLLRSPSGSAIGIIVQVQDITQRKAAENALQEARDNLEQAVAARTKELELANRMLRSEITERQQAEEALRESEARLTQAQNIAKIGHTVWDEIEGRMSYHSETVDLIWGSPPEEIFATFAEFLNTVHPDDRDRVDLAMEQAIKDRTGFEIDYRIVRPDGEIQFIREIAEPERDKTGRLVRTVSTVQDITEQKHAEKELRESEARYRELFDESPVAIWEEDWTPIKHMLDDLARDGVKDWRGYFGSHREQLKKAYDSAEILNISRAAIDLYHEESIDDLLRRSAGGVVIDEELDAFLEILLLFLAGQMFTDVESKDVAGDGSEIIVRRQVVMPPKHRDGWSRVIYAVEDITERVRAEEQLRQAQKMETVGQLTGGVAHDFNNLLAVIMGNTELLEDRLGKEDPSLAPVLRAAKRGAELTQRLLAFSRQQSLSPQAVDLGLLASGMSTLLSRTLGATVAIDTIVEADLWAASADPGQLENALLNLAINARDAMPGGGRLTIECANAQLEAAYVANNPEAKVGAYAMLAVSDEGSGMTAEVQAHAFEPFFTTKDVGQGSGLGLSMIYGFAKQSGGHVSIYSEEGRGTTVKLYLPRAEEAARRADAQDEAEVPQGAGEMILVIEDDPDVRVLAVQLLEHLGYRTIEVADAAAAQQALANGVPVDLVLSDVVLPGGTSGPEFAEAVRAIYPDLKIIFMSGYPAEAAKRNGFLGSDSVLLSKPFQRHQLAKALQEALV